MAKFEAGGRGEGRKNSGFIYKQKRHLERLAAPENRFVIVQLNNVLTIDSMLDCSKKIN